MFKMKELPGAESPGPIPGFCSCILPVGAAVEGLFSVINTIGRHTKCKVKGVV